MALFDKLFSTKRKLDASRSRDRRSCKINPEQVRLLLFKECDWRGRKVLFDSASIERRPAGKHDLPNSKRPAEPHVVEVSNGFTYVYKGPVADASALGEMIFGAVALNYKGVSLKIHIMDEPRRLMCTKLFCVPTSRRVSRRPGSESGRRTSSVPGREEVALSFSCERTDSGFYNEHSLHSSVSSTCDFFSMFDVWDGNATQEDFYTFHSPSGRKLSTSSNGSWQRRTFRNLATRFDLGSQSSHLLSVPTATSNITSCDSQTYSNSSTSGTSDSLASGGSASNAAPRKNKLGLALLITVADSDQMDLVRRCVEHSAQLQALVCRLRMATLTAGGAAGFVHTLHTASLDAAQCLSDLMYGPRVQSVWLSLVTSDRGGKMADTLLADLCNVLAVGDTKHTNFFISTLLTHVLTHHLGWVTTVSPYDVLDPQQVHEESAARPYNALWAQLSDLCGSIGFPPKAARTIISGGGNAHFLNRLLAVLTYFVRCGEVKRNTYRYSEQSSDKVKLVNVRTSVSKSASGSAMERTSTQKVPLESAMKRTSTQKVPSESATKRTSVQKVHSESVMKRTSTPVSDCALKRTSTQKVLAYSGLNKPTLEALSDSTLTKTSSQEVITESVLKRTSTQNVLVDSALKRTFTHKVLSGTLEKSATLGTLSSSALKRTFSQNVLSDSTLKNTSANEVSPVSTLKRTPTQKVLVDNSLKVLNTHSDSSDTLKSEVSFKRSMTLADISNNICIEPMTSQDKNSPALSLKSNSSSSLNSTESEPEQKVVFVLGDDEKLVGLKNKSIGGKSVKKSTRVEAVNFHVKETVPIKECDVKCSRSSESPSRCCAQTLQHSKPVKHSGFKFEFDKYPQIVTNYMKSKNLEILDRHYIGKPGNLKLDNFQFDPTVVPPIQEERCEACYKCQMESTLQTPTNASELEFMNDMPRASEYASAVPTKEETPVISPKVFTRVTKENTVLVNVTTPEEAPVNSEPKEKEVEAKVERETVKQVLECPMCLMEEPLSSTHSGFDASLLGGVTDHYVPDLILQGTLAKPDSWEAQLRRDLELTSYLNKTLDAPISAIAIIGDTSVWEVRVVGRDGTAASGMSALVGAMLDALPHMWRAKVPAHQCLSFLEAKLREFCVLSKTLADMLMSTDFCDIATLTKSLNIDINDVPLLMAVATTHTPQVARRYGISYR